MGSPDQSPWEAIEETKRLVSCEKGLTNSSNPNWEAIEETKRLVSLLLQAIVRHRDQLASLAGESARLYAMTAHLRNRLTECSEFPAVYVAPSKDFELNPASDDKWERLARGFEAIDLDDDAPGEEP
jgi:hypothetical protein